MRTKSNVAWLIVLLAMALAFRRAATPVSAVGFTPSSQLQSPASLPAVALRAASGATLSFKTQNGDTVDGILPQRFDLPHLVLYRNGVLTQAGERTLSVEVNGIKVPAPGVTVTLKVETQHQDPDARPDVLRPYAREDVGRRISVWRESQWIAHSPDTHQVDVTARFVHAFGPTVPTGAGRIPTPTDYFRYELTVTGAGHPSTDPLYAWSEDYAFLMENQQIARLPEVREASPGAAPDELVLYYADMVPFRKDSLDPNTWLSRAEVAGYVGAELLPRMVEAYRVQSDEWGYPWYPAWTGRRSEDGDRLGVALSDGRTWYHGPAPTGRGLSDISINVSRGNAVHDTLTDGLIDIFYHELFHHHQRNINLHSGRDGWTAGKDSAWQFFSEGTATMATSVGQPGVQFTRTLGTRNYVDHANQFIQWGSGRFQDLITNDGGTDAYSAALYWRFLYEQCGGLSDGGAMKNRVEDPAAGMAIIRRALTVLYAGEIVDIDASTDLISATPKVLDQALAGSSCPFQTYEESLVAFARAIYGLRISGGRCVEPGVPAGCGLYDPHALYGDPLVRTVVFNGAAQDVQSDMMSNYDMDWIDVVFAPAAEGKPLTIELEIPPASGIELHVQVLHLADAYESARPRHNLVPPAAAEVCAERHPKGRLLCVIPEIRTANYSRLGLIITRVGGKAAEDSMGQYTIVLRPDTK